MGSHPSRGVGFADRVSIQANAITINPDPWRLAPVRVERGAD